MPKRTAHLVLAGLLALLAVIVLLHMPRSVPGPSTRAVAVAAIPPGRPEPFVVPRSPGESRGGTAAVRSTRALRSETGSSQASGAGYWAYQDPATGALTQRPTKEQASAFRELDPRDLNGAGTSSEGLVEVPSPVAHGGIMVDVRGRFMSGLTATLDSTGSVTATCGPVKPEAVREGE